MHLLLIRHAIAEDRDVFAQTGNTDDNQRPLTEDGSRKMRETVKGIRREVPKLSMIVSSPLLRAQQTAAIVREGYPTVSMAELEALAPRGNRGDILAWLTRRPQVDPIALVGHEPDLGELAAWMISGKPAKGAGIMFKKGGAAFIEFPASPEAGTAMLLWLLQPGQLRKLG